MDLPTAVQREAHRDKSFPIMQGCGWVYLHLLSVVHKNCTNCNLKLNGNEQEIFIRLLATTDALMEKQNKQLHIIKHPTVVTCFPKWHIFNGLVSACSIHSSRNHWMLPAGWVGWSVEEPSSILSCHFTKLSIYTCCCTLHHSSHTIDTNKNSDFTCFSVCGVVSFPPFCFSYCFWNHSMLHVK